MSAVKYAEDALHAAEKTTGNGAVKAGTVAAGGTAIATGVVASTMSGAAMMSTLATVGAGSAAVGVGVVASAPIAIGTAVFVVWRWCTDDDDDDDDDE